jgi:hypothetical protein
MAVGQDTRLLLHAGGAAFEREGERGKKQASMSKSACKLAACKLAISLHANCNTEAHKALEDTSTRIVQFLGVEVIYN